MNTPNSNAREPQQHSSAQATPACCQRCQTPMICILCKKDTAPLFQSTHQLQRASNPGAANFTHRLERVLLLVDGPHPGKLRLAKRCVLRRRGRRRPERAEGGERRHGRGRGRCRNRERACAGGSQVQSPAMTHFLWVVTQYK